MLHPLQLEPSYSSHVPHIVSWQTNHNNHISLAAPGVLIEHIYNLYNILQYLLDIALA